ncbi:hypothetical protein [Roseateles sp. LKC17W]|uniref:Uncharacterized protein n=1 Tax=Pelomonas margarita TaxID=3299031 RepID=A0ABW7FKJ0_9BURK
MLLLALPAAVLITAGWVLWQNPAPTPAPVAAAVPASVPRLPVEVLPQPAAHATALSPAPEGCAPSTLPVHELALGWQRALAVLASGSGADVVLGLLLQPPPAEDLVAQAQWSSQVRDAALRSQDALALRWATAACPGAACRRELLQARLRLEPGNAVHWAAWLEEAPDDADAAWQGLAAAGYWHEQPRAWLTRLGAALPAAWTPAQRQAVLRGLPAPAWAESPAPSVMLANACGHYGASHPVGAACAHVVTLMLTRSDAPQAWQQGAALARQLGRADIPPSPAAPAVVAMPACPASQSSR